MEENLYYYKARVRRVIDGDTIVAESRSIRLLGINTPERGEEYYLEAKEFLEDYLYINQKLRFRDKLKYQITVAEEIEEFTHVDERPGALVVGKQKKDRRKNDEHDETRGLERNLVLREHDERKDR